MKSERESRIPLLVWAAEAKGNCVAARRGGEQQEVNNQSVRQKHDSAGRFRRAGEGKAKPKLQVELPVTLRKCVKAMIGNVRWLVTEWL